MNTSIKNLITVACVAIDPAAAYDFHRWTKKRRNKQEDEKKEQELQSPWPPPSV